MKAVILLLAASYLSLTGVQGDVVVKGGTLQAWISSCEKGVPLILVTRSCVAAKTKKAPRCRLENVHLQCPVKISPPTRSGIPLPGWKPPKSRRGSPPAQVPPSLPALPQYMSGMIQKQSDFINKHFPSQFRSPVKGNLKLIEDFEKPHILPYPFPRLPKRGLSSSVRRKLSKVAQRRSLVESFAKRLRPICCRYHITCPRQRRQARYGLSEALQEVNRIWEDTKTKVKRFTYQQARRFCCAFKKPCPAGV